MPVRPYTRDQDWLLPASIGELVPQDHVARFVAAIVDELDFDALGIRDVPHRFGAPRYHGRMLLAGWLYGFMTRCRSTRKLERACRENVPLMWLTGMQQPDHVTLWRFYKRNRGAMRDLFRYTVRLSIEAGMVKFALQAIDGSKVAAASANSLKDMAALNRLLQQVDWEIAVLEEENRQAEDDPRGDRHRRITKKGQLRDRVAKAMEQLRAQDDEAGGDTPRRRRSRSGREKVASTTDPDAQLMKGSHGWEVGYNAQAVVDSANQIVVAADVSTEKADNHELMPMLDEAECNTGRTADRTVADSGYFSDDNLKRAMGRTDLHMPDPRLKKKKGDPSTWAYHKEHFSQDDREDVYICPQGKKLTYSHTTASSTRNRHPLKVYRCHECASCPVRDECTSDAYGRTIKINGYEAVVRAHWEKMQTARARKVMELRKFIVEPVFGIIKEQMDARRFLLRGLSNVQAEWHFLCTAFNLRKLYKYWWLPGLAPANTAL